MSYCHIYVICHKVIAYHGVHLDNRLTLFPLSGTLTTPPGSWRRPTLPWWRTGTAPPRGGGDSGNLSWYSSSKWNILDILAALKIFYFLILKIFGKFPPEFCSLCAGPARTWAGCTGRATPWWGWRAAGGRWRDSSLRRTSSTRWIVRTQMSGSSPL